MHSRRVRITAVFSLRNRINFLSLEILSSYQCPLKGTNLTNPYSVLVQASYPSVSDGASVVKKTTIHLDYRDKRKTGEPRPSFGVHVTWDVIEQDRKSVV